MSITHLSKSIDLNKKIDFENEYLNKLESRVENQELYCHNCGRYVQFPIDLSLNGNHVLNCPNCNHEHCRVVKNGIITDDRWDQRNGDTYNIYSSVLTTTTTATSGSLYFSSWGTSASTGGIYSISGSSSIS